MDFLRGYGDKKVKSVNGYSANRPNHAMEVLNQGKKV